VLLGVSLVVDELLLPELVAFVDNLNRVLLALGLAGKGKDVLRLAVWDLVDPQPLVGGLKKRKKMFAMTFQSPSRSKDDSP
jgi:hypothetical protein